MFATSSHDLDGNLKPDGVPIEIESADIIFIEGNFPFCMRKSLILIAIKVVYLTDDPIRFKRKWKRDIDYRKKYEPRYFCNRYFKDQFIMANFSYIPQMALLTWWSIPLVRPYGLLLKSQRSLTKNDQGL